MEHDDISFWLVAAVLAAIAGIVFLVRGGEDLERVTNALSSAGFTEVQLLGRASPWSCSEDDVYRTKFKAQNPVGAEVEGVVCCGLAKGCTVRF
jgi:hypothetical protein